MNYYGCCEPINGRWNIVKQIPNLRRVSASPWADLNPMAEMSGKDAGRAARWCRIAREELLG